MTAARDHITVLDGWRGASILLVLAGHLFPLGPKIVRMNETIAAMGMVLFFILSGFLITSFLLKQPSVGSFLIRRIFRIVPLAWAASVLMLSLKGADIEKWSAHIFFYLNLPPFLALNETAHLWSLSMEVQFYLAIALLVGALGKRSLSLLPVFCVMVTVARVIWHEEISIVTWFRIDEILAGCMLALLADRYGRVFPATRWGAVLPVVLALALLASCSPYGGAINYLRPYLAAALIGSTLFMPRSWLARALDNRVLVYLAAVSYAVYVLHPLLASTWLGSGDTFVKYAKRPLLMAALFLLAHVSTRYFESRFIEAGRSLANRWTGGRKQEAAP